MHNTNEQQHNVHMKIPYLYNMRCAQKAAECLERWRAADGRVQFAKKESIEKREKTRKTPSVDSPVDHHRKPTTAGAASASPNI